MGVTFYGSRGLACVEMEIVVGHKHRLSPCVMFSMDGYKRARMLEYNGVRIVKPTATMTGSVAIVDIREFLPRDEFADIVCHDGIKMTVRFSHAGILRMQTGQVIVRMCEKQQIVLPRDLDAVVDDLDTIGFYPIRRGIVCDSDSTSATRCGILDDGSVVIGTRCVQLPDGYVLRRPRTRCHVLLALTALEFVFDAAATLPPTVDEFVRHVRGATTTTTTMEDERVPNWIWVQLACMWLLQYFVLRPKVGIWDVVEFVHRYVRHVMGRVHAEFGRENKFAVIEGVLAVYGVPRFVVGCADAVWAQLRLMRSADPLDMVVSIDVVGEACGHVFMGRRDDSGMILHRGRAYGWVSAVYAVCMEYATTLQFEQAVARKICALLCTASDDGSFFVPTVMSSRLLQVHNLLDEFGFGDLLRAYEVTCIVRMYVAGDSSAWDGVADALPHIAQLATGAVGRVLHVDLAGMKLKPGRNSKTGSPIMWCSFPKNRTCAKFNCAATHGGGAGKVYLIARVDKDGNGNATIRTHSTKHRDAPTLGFVSIERASGVSRVWLYTGVAGATREIICE